MAAHDQDRAHNGEPSVANHNRGCGSKRQKPGDIDDISLQNTACANVQSAEEDLSRPLKIQRLQPPESISSPDITVVSATKYDPPPNTPPPLPHLQPEAMHIAQSTSGRALQRDNLDGYSDASVDLDAESEGKANAAEGDEGKEDTIPESPHTEPQSSSPSKPIFTSPDSIQMLRAKFYSLRDWRRQQLREKYAPVTQPDNHNASSNNDTRQLIKPTSTDENEDIHHSPHHLGKLNTTSASQESFEGEWLDDIDPELWPDGKTTVGDDAGHRSS